MSELRKALELKIGEHRVHSFNRSSEDYIDLLLLDIETKIPIKILMTDGLSEYKMPVPERYKGKEFNEIYFALPSYWEIEDKENPLMRWPIDQIQKLAKHVIENETWYSHGHTFSNGTPPENLSENMKQNHLMLTDPILLEDLFQPLTVGDKTIYFLAIVPLFEDEFDHKLNSGYFKFIRKFRSKNGDEVLDDYRTSIYRSRWRIYG
jgi:hypothetical protein